MSIHGPWLNHGWRSIRCQPEITSSNPLPGFHIYPSKTKNSKFIEMHIYYIYNYDYVQFIASFSYIIRVYHRAFIVRQAWGYRGTRDVLIRAQVYTWDHGYLTRVHHWGFLNYHWGQPRAVVSHPWTNYVRVAYVYNLLIIYAAH